MATTNGTLTPPLLAQAPASPSSLKRKRSESASLPQSNGITADTKKEEPNVGDSQLHTLFADIYGILQSYDTKPSILEHNLHPPRGTSSSGEPAAKRAKTGDGDDDVTIARKLKDGAYNSVDALVEDVETASSQVLASVKPNEMMTNGLPSRYVPPSFAETRLVTGLLAFKKVLKNIVLREVHRQSSIKKVEKAVDAEEEDVKPSINGTAESKPSAMDGDDAGGRTVLTLFANASGPRMLFSSLQQPTRVSKLASTKLDTSVDVTLPIQESTLPNVISATKIVPIHVEDTKNEKKRASTFGELFAPPASVPQLSPPKPAKSLTTRGSSVTWVPPESTTKSSRTGFVYSKQSLSSGQWLGYSGIDGSKESATAEAKQKHRQRALSTGEANPPLSEATVAALNQAKEDALFRSAYSSFAPTHDDAIAIVPSETKNQIWWHKVGSKKFVENFAIDPELLGDAQDETSAAINGADEDAEEKAFAEAVELFDPEQMPRPFPDETKEEKETNEILQEISELLETLHSYQRIRNSSLTTSSRTPVVQNASLAQLNGTPSSPSSAEKETYNTLKTQLSLMIQMLPPYAVAKLNGDQLADLNISRNIVIETKDYRGVMEEDPLTRLSKANAISAATGQGSSSRTQGSHPPYSVSSNQFARGAPIAHAASARPPHSSYYPHQQPPVRSPSLQYSQSRTTSSAYQTPGGYGGAAPRQSFPAQPGYSQQTARPSFVQQPPATSFYQAQRSSQSYGMASTYYPQTPQSATQNRGYQATQHPPYAQSPRPGGTAPGYNYSYSSSSPIKHSSTPTGQPAHMHAQYQQPPPPGGYTTPMIGQAPRTATGGAAPGTPGFSYSNRNPAPPATAYGNATHPSGYAPQGAQSSQPGTPGVASAVGPSGFHTSMTNAEQQSMLERQRAALNNRTPGGVPQRTASATPAAGTQVNQGAATQGSEISQAQVNGAT